MEQKIFDMMEKMYSEMQKGFSQVNKRLDNLEEGQNKLETDVNTIGNQVTKLENDIKPKLKAALDGYKVVYEKLENFENKVDKLAETVESHDVKIEVIKRVK